MEQSKAELIYWATCSLGSWIEFDQDRSDYLEIKKARVWIEEKYFELKKKHGYSANSKSKIEWLMRQ